ncbi:MAG: hypothetical protein Q6373_025505 [Candidatus Sigynarchaeota archaeon]
MEMLAHQIIYPLGFLGAHDTADCTHAAQDRLHDNSPCQIVRMGKIGMASLEHIHVDERYSNRSHLDGVSSQFNSVQVEKMEKKSVTSRIFLILER